MKVTVTFIPLHKVSLDDLYGNVGVYVLWSKRDNAKPGYIGEGLLLQRFSNHVTRTSVLYDKLPWPLKGLFAIIGEENKKNLETVKLVESILLCVAKMANRSPRLNSTRGEISKLEEVFKRHQILRLILKGYDPLLRPYTSIHGQKEIILQVDNRGYIYCANRPWRVR